MPRLTATRDELVNTTFAVAAVIVVTFVVGDIGLLGSVIGFVIAGLIVLPLSILGHELGHALAVSRLGRRNCMVIVGRGPFMRFTAGRAVVLFSVLPTRGVPFAGVCRYDPSGLPGVRSGGSRSPDRWPLPPSSSASSRPARCCGPSARWPGSWSSSPRRS